MTIPNDLTDSSDEQRHKKVMDKENISRYSRQILLPNIRMKGQTEIINSSVLVVGAGGLGAPVIMYLAAAGIGSIGIVDYDVVESSNLQRQVIHDEQRLGVLKADSAAEFAKRLNGYCQVHSYNLVLDSSNALEIIEKYDIIVDATDNVATRYLLNDACILLQKPLVSGSALRMEGQLTTYNFQGGPCYRCIFPKPPPPETVTNCSDGGVLGAITGTIGSLQALEVIRIITEKKSNYSQKLLLFDGCGGTFRTIKLRPKKSDCEICSDQPVITSLIDYVQFCGSGAVDKTPPIDVLESEKRISCKEYNEIRKSNIPHVLVDVREDIQYEICRLENSINIPFAKLSRNVDKLMETIQEEGDERQKDIYFICRRGNDSQLAVCEIGKRPEFSNVVIKDITGGFESWTQDVDPEFPSY